MKTVWQRGFSLVEMTIVLVIIGLILGGILFGKSLLTASRLQTVVTDADNYITITGNFKQAYLALPGDMQNATDQWGTDSAGCPSGGGATGTCNGDGNGKIGGSSGEYGEVFRFWQQLYLANMYSKKLTGLAANVSSYDGIANSNVPGGSIPGSLYFVFYPGSIPGNSTDMIAGNYGNSLLFGGPLSGTIGIGVAGVITPEQAATIDAKIDDGLPASGKLRGPKYTSTIAPNCTANTSPISWNTTNTQPGCSLIFMMPY